MTDDEDKPKRPNANYKLSKSDNVENIGDENLTFYYNRERRLAKAPQSVRDLYASKKQARFSLLRPLVADKPRAMLFFSIIIICAFIYVMSLMGFFDSSYSLDGNNIEISGTKFEDIAIVVVKKTVKKGEVNAYSGAVDIAVSPVVSGVEEFPIFYHRVFFTMEQVEEYSFAVPFDSPDLLIVIQTEKNSINARFKPK
jgi:hypothetical protein